MKRIKRWVIVGLALSAASANAAELPLRSQILEKNGWSAYHVAMVAGAGSPCCQSGDRGRSSNAACDLDTRKGSFSISDSGSKKSTNLGIYWHVSKGTIDQVKAFAEECPVSSREAIRWIGSVDPKESVAATLEWIDRAGEDHHSMALAALALQAEPSATPALISLAAPRKSTGTRKDAIFWLGQARGVDGANFVGQVASNDPVIDIREHAVFSLSQSRVNDAYERVRKVSRDDSATDVRSKALFWMAQMQDSRSAADIDAALTAETSEEVREQAVFALSQLDDGKAAPALIAVVRGNHPRAIKEKALFWLSQSESDEAIAFLDEMLTK